MNAKEYLDSFYDLNKRIDANQKALDVLNSMLFKLNQQMNPDRVQTSKDLDPLGTTVAKIIDLQEEINNMIDEYVDKLSEVMFVINQVSDPKEYDLLHKHYIQGYSWTYISQLWDNSNTWVHEVKRNALESVQKILDEKGGVK